jgi:ribosome-binding protein aMBF1 (putative translation factor)
MVVQKRKNMMEEIREELAQDRDLNATYQRELARLRVANQIAVLRARSGMSQAELAAKIGTKQAGVARMERANYTGYTMGTLAKIAAAMGAHLEVRFVLPDKGRGVVTKGTGRHTKVDP